MLAEASLKINLVGNHLTVWLRNRHMELGRNEKYVSRIFSCLNSACICHLICVLLQFPYAMHRNSLNFGNIKFFLDTEISAYLHFLHCVHIWDELACLWGRLCMVTLYYRMTFKPHADMIICGWEYLLKWSGCVAEHRNRVKALKVQDSVHMCWLPIAARTCACANSWTCYLFFLNKTAEHNTILFELKLGWGFWHLWRYSNENKGDRRYHICPTISTWL